MTDVLATEVGDNYTAERIDSVGGEHVYALAGSEHASLDGWFTADQLEAIAAWMRNPHGPDGKGHCVDVL